MVILRHSAAPLRAVRCVRQTAPSARRTISATPRRQGGGHGNESHYDAPGGWLWGVKPGEKPEPEGWERPMYFFFGGLILTGVALAYKPDTSVSTWALEEARRRLEAEGILPDPTAQQSEK
ncbi:ESSS subunit of NADH:ubiquinone oxidoreductase-domain-containing protein [Stachybotrys elegans]|uniref:NADH dehydrogenase [ubiquinone] 1 beta subcomplex subunit 11, mitochondrial n=1 Tax=Stachybotrys elegans TaxID=80388 RepID=A0A8K0SRS1_9HYPO|nr:ESSS subunit of NADH:ubiquinone oxidoreductase-domain-containing protein [Stachybotrys elegans]